MKIYFFEKFFPFFLFPLSATFAAENSCEQAECEQVIESFDPVYSTITLSHVFGKGIGFDSGYTSLEAFWVPSLFTCDTIAPFIDLRAHYFDDNEWAANGGIGVRFLPEHSNFAFGINGYFDYRSEKNHDLSFTQWGIGVEVLGCCIELRANGYFPIRKSHVIQECRFFYDDQYFIFQDRIVRALPGADVEFGTHFCFCSGALDIFAGAGGYVYGGNTHHHPVGGRFRLLIGCTDYFYAQATLTHDTFYKTRFQGEIGLQFPLGCPPPCDCVRLRNLSRRAYRNEIIPLDEYCCWNFNF